MNRHVHIPAHHEQTLHTLAAQSPETAHTLQDLPAARGQENALTAACSQPCVKT